MKRILRRGALVAALLIAVPGAGAASSYSVASLNGTCVWQGIYYPTTGGDQVQAGPATILAPLTFDGAGHLTVNYDSNVNGTFTSASVVSGTYTVDATGHGSFTYLSPATGTQVVYDFRISPHGHLIRTILQSNVSGPVSTRVSDGICSFNE